MLNLQIAGEQATTQPKTSAAATPKTPPPIRPHGAQPASSGVISVSSQPTEKITILVAGTVIGIVLLTGVTASFLTAGSQGEADKQRTALQDLQQQLRSGSAATLLTRAQTVQKQLSTVNSFLAGAIAWPDLLDSLASLLPTSTKLTSATFESDSTIRLEGEVASQQDVATFMAALDNSSQFATPTLGSVALNESVDGSVVIFSLTTEYLAPAQDQAEPTETGGTEAVPSVDAGGVGAESAVSDIADERLESAGSDASGGPDGE